ncbi:uncharacterized protein I303_104724 [Kwoniella dejecticola CBS 10117]|uniref:GAR domain-containing protein n=1 Tax=Kwoniella dejecticola CBS 10117 TaxID=1296121 RepID=A0AAJ8KQT5_9TREE
MATASSGHDDLKDLAPEEAQELRAFVEKRRWFESKLKLLEDVSPIYPFVHPVLIQHQNPALCRQGESSSQWRLPSVTAVTQWQDERDKLEEEVLLFDGGDLGRMKEKTRAATQLPLTPPSTHLVSITLNLIVLIDRILSLLRRRGQLLELTLVRLRWDQMRWEIMLETERIRKEVGEIVRDKGRWRPAVHEPSLGANPQPGSMILESPQTPPAARKLPTSSSLNSLADAASPQLSPSNKKHSSPRHSLHITLVHSQLVSLQVRLRNISSNQMKRSGVLLDQMIDLAGPMKNVGGVSGPNDGQGGAVPDQLLDLQDDLEAMVKDLSGRIVWCEQLTKYWEGCQRYHAATLDVSDRSNQLLQLIRLHMEQPATSERHSDLANRLSIIEARMPDRLPPAPIHTAYLEDAQHNREINEALQNGYDQAQGVFKICLAGIEWYGKLEEGRRSVSAEVDQAKDLIQQLRDAVGELSRYDNTVIASDPDQYPEIQDSSIANLIKESKRWSEEGMVLSQKLKITNARYHNLWRRAFTPLEMTPGQDELITKAEAEAEELLDLANKAAKLIEVAEGHRRMLGLLDPVLRATKEICSSLVALEESTSTGMRQNQWPRCQEIDARLVDEKHQVDQQILDLKQNSLPPLMQIFGLELSKSRTHVEDIVEEIINRQIGIHRSFIVMESMHRQAEAVQRFNLRKKSLQEEAEEIGPLRDGCLARIEALQLEFDLWSSSIAESIPFLAEISDTQSDSLPDTMQEETDRAVRNHVNRSTLQVASAIANCRIALRRHNNDKWEERCRAAGSRIDQVVLTWMALRREIEGVGGHHPALEEQRKDCQDALRSLEEAISARPAGVTDANNWASTLAPAQVAIASVLSEIEGIKVTFQDSSAETRTASTAGTALSRPPSVASTRARTAASRLPRLTSSIPRPINSSTSDPSEASRASSDTPPRHRVLSMQGTWPRPSRLSMSTRETRKEYVADARSKLDMAVGHVVNKLDVHVPIRPVGINNGDDWQDQSGQYWIGAEGRAKLCFCRILRSRTVMVRVGGGWVELSSGELCVPTSLSFTPETPVKKTVALPDTPSPVKNSSGPGSPLQALRFMRRASESPSVREKEKEKFKGRRSILGKDYPTNT